MPQEQAKVAKIAADMAAANANATALADEIDAAFGK
jgi:hypothetical protein